MVVQGHVTQQGLLHILTAVEPVGLQNVRYAAVEALHHAVGSRGSWLGQPVFDPQLLAQLVQLMVAAGLALAAGKQAVRELLACWRRFKIEPPCRLNFEPGLMANL